MIVRNAAIAALALLAAACGEDTCPTESPQVSQVADCTVRPGAAVTYPVQLCPTCNQTGATCDVDTSAVGPGSGDIFLDPKVEVCTAATSCPPTCDVTPFACTFDAPTVEGNYTVSVVNGASGAVVTRTLRVSATESVSCALVPT